MERLEDGKRLGFLVSEAEQGLTLGGWLRRKGFTKAQISSMKFRENGLTVNGERARVSRVLRGGERVAVQLEEPTRESAHLEEAKGRLEILYEDQDLIVLWKQAQEVLHPAHGHYGDTLSNRLHRYFRERGEYVTIRSIGRLDRDTSGLVVFAKNQVAAARLWKQKEEGSFQKEYLALCARPEKMDTVGTAAGPGKWNMVNAPAGQEEWHTICAPIGPAPGELMKMCVSPEGKRAVTHYQIMRRTQETLLMRVQIETGRTHQIRVHMAFMGCPIIGDPLYGKEYQTTETEQPLQGKKNRTQADEGRLQLYAWKVWLRQPFTGEEICIERKPDVLQYFS